MLENNRLIVCLLIFAVCLSPFGFLTRTAQAQTDEINEKLRIERLETTGRKDASVTINSTEDFSSEPPPTENLLPAPARFSASPNIAIPDDSYAGGFGGTGQACSTISTTSLPAGSSVADVGVNLSVVHSWVGDLTVKLRSPNGTVLTILNRPGSNAPDDGTDSPIGDSSDWNGAEIAFRDGSDPEAETMGSGIGDNQNICTANGVCAHDPSPNTATQPPASFAAFRDEQANGNWTLCVGDSALGDAGTFRAWSLNLVPARSVTVSPALTIPDDGYTGGFGTTGQACTVINTTTSLPAGTIANDVYINVSMTHTWVGDLTMKLRSPNGTTLTVLNRPGSNAPDDGSGAIGNSTNWSGSSIRFRDNDGPEAETMGASLNDDQRICLDNGVCSHDPSPNTATQPPANFAAFNGTTAIGNWTLCVGDSTLGDVGTLNSWSLRVPFAFAPTAAGASVSGRVLTAAGAGVSGALVKLIDAAGEERFAHTNPFGYYRFEDVPAGATYVAEVVSKRFVFAPQAINLGEDLTELNFTAAPE